MSKKWFVVHDETAFLENSKVIGISESQYSKGEMMNIGDYVFYYLKGGSKSIRGLYMIVEKGGPNSIEISWNNKIQFGIIPLIQPKEALNIDNITKNLSIFKLDDIWYKEIQGPNSIKELTDADTDFLKYELFKKI